MYTLIGYKKCSTCKNAEKLLKEKNIDYKYREIDKDVPSKIELEQFLNNGKTNIESLFNTSGKLYRELNIKDLKKTMSKNEILDLLSKNGMLIKRPILITDTHTYIGKEVKEFLDK